MSRRSIAALLVFFAVFPPARAADPRLEEVLGADRAFAARAAESGAQAAFLEVLAPDAVLFRPLAVRAGEWMRTHEEATGRLEWSPATGRVSCDGQLAVTLGPWTYRQDTLVDTGAYLTVWQRNGAGVWRVAVDHGIDGSPAAAVPTLPSLPTTVAGDCAGTGGGETLARADEKLNDAIRGKGMDAALRRLLAPGALVLRDGHAAGPATGDWPRDDATWREASAVSSGLEAGADLGYTYGQIARRRQRKSPPAIDGVYLRVWQRSGREWLLLADMTTAVAGQAAAP